MSEKVAGIRRYVPEHEQTLSIWKQLCEASEDIAPVNALVRGICGVVHHDPGMVCTLVNLDWIRAHPATGDLTHRVAQGARIGYRHPFEVFRSEMMRIVWNLSSESDKKGVDFEQFDHLVQERWPEAKLHLLEFTANLGVPLLAYAVVHRTISWGNMQAIVPLLLCRLSSDNGNLDEQSSIDGILLTTIDYLVDCLKQSRVALAS